MAGLGINLGYFLVQVFSFLIVFVLLSALVYRPLLNMLEQRRQTIAQGLEDARLAGEARANAEKDAQAVLAKAQQDAHQRTRQAAEAAEQVAREIKAAAEKEAAEIRVAAAAEAEQAKHQALTELRGQVAALSIAAAEKLIRESLDERRQRALIAEFFSGIRGGKVTLLEGEKIAGASAQVTSALPLTSDEQRILREEVESRIGKGSAITFKVDPRVLGGLVICVGDKVLDGSVAGGLEGLRQSLH
ncbi:MAG: F0F1 ATP synthase subunit B [Anaerolineales bacterium]|nr:F0F1 ATP synthase subunit B [Anaerolineales bacterium]